MSKKHINLSQAEQIVTAYIRGKDWKYFNGNKYHQFRKYHKRLNDGKPLTLHVMQNVMTEMGHQIFFK